jgi:hypothetical protein
MIDGEVRKYQQIILNLRRRMKLQTRQTFMRQSGIKIITNQRGRRGRKPRYKNFVCKRTFRVHFVVDALLRREELLGGVAQHTRTTSEDKQLSQKRRMYWALQVRRENDQKT